MKRSLNKTGFNALLATQFLGAFNDNAFKLVISLLAVDLLVMKTGGTEYLSLAGVIFILPFLLFSTCAGYLADRLSKQKIIIGTKVLELLIMAAGFVALLKRNIWGIYTVLFFMGLQSTFFSPAKYAVLPEILSDEDLSEGNGAIQLWTYMAIIFGTACGGYVFYLLKTEIYKTSYVFMGIAGIGILTSLFVSKVKPSGSTRNLEWNFLSEIIRNTKRIKKDKPVFLSILGLVYFSLFAGLFQLNILLYARKIMGVNQFHTSILLTLVALGLGLGSYIAGKLSEHKIEFGLVPLGTIGLSTFSIFLGFSYKSFMMSACLLFILGLCSGFYIVPLNALVQKRSPEERRGQVLATLNFLSFSAILAASGVLYVFRELFRLNAAQIFLVMGIASIGATLYILKVLPEAFIRLADWMFAHSIYKIKKVGMENMPKEGGALLVCNHVSYADPVLVLASVQRPIRFMVFRPIYNNPLLKPFCKITKAIPVSFRDRPKTIMKSFQEAREAVQNGELVCIFAEGGLTRTGNMLAFNKGFEHIMKDLDAPIIPMNIDRIWGSIFSYEDDKYFWKIPRHLPYPITISFGKPLASSSKVHEVRIAVQELSAEAFKYRAKSQHKLPVYLIDEAKKHPFKFCMADSMGIKLNYLQTLTSMCILSRKLFTNGKQDKEMVGVFLPASCVASMVNGAAFISGKIPVNLNFTSSKESIEYAVKECNMKTIITSRRFLEKINFDPNEKMIFLEDMLSKIKTLEKVFVLILNAILPSFLIKAIFLRGNRYDIDEMATVIFSSGSTGTPKGVMLSHGNILSNLQGLYQILNTKSSDVIMGVLPFFHSFGFTATLCFPLGVGLGVVYHSNPLDSKTIGKLVEKYKATIILGTPTFISAYTRKCSQEQFKSLRYAIVGAEKLKRSVAEAFNEKFKVTPLEGYGATELSPIVSMGIPDYISKEEHIRQIGYKEGKVGHPLPNIAIKIVDQNTNEILSSDQEGLLMVKGPNVMMGYLNQPEKTSQVIRNDWYITGDIATIDSDGFLCITDRLSRFSKIGGEMVPHIKVEEVIQDILADTEQVCAVTSVSDEKKGEQLVVLYKGDLDIDKLWKDINEEDIPKLWIPKREYFHRVETMPLLGSGKLDLKKIKKLAQELTQGFGKET
ncbi:MAG: MFS transporter [Candidatus Omnitrophica bacterium]|nr:MFS transporter [Candidatus Omnitrophota bacterium]